MDQERAKLDVWLPTRTVRLDVASSIFDVTIRLPLLFLIGEDERNRLYYIGEGAQNKRDVDGLRLRYPIKRGVIENWAEMEMIWDYAFHDLLRIRPEEHAILSSEMPLTSKTQREKMTEIMFERFNAPAFSVCVDSALCFYSTGEFTGITLSIGDGVTHVVPVYQCSTIRHGIRRLDLAGSDITDHLSKRLSERGYQITSQDTKRDIKHTQCFVASNYEEEMTTSSFAFRKKYTLPDGKVIQMDSERFSAPEILFTPTLVGLEADGVDKTIYNSVQNCDPDLHRQLLRYVVPVGGTTLIPGFTERLKKNLSVLFPSHRVKLIVREEREMSVFIGASILADLSTFQPYWVLKEHYDEYGPKIVHYRCLS